MKVIQVFNKIIEYLNMGDIFIGMGNNRKPNLNGLVKAFEI